jgi:hypothetical protein
MRDLAGLSGQIPSFAWKTASRARKILPARSPGKIWIQLRTKDSDWSADLA